MQQKADSEICLFVRWTSIEEYRESERDRGIIISLLNVVIRTCVCLFGSFRVSVLWRSIRQYSRYGRIRDCRLESIIFYAFFSYLFSNTFVVFFDTISETGLLKQLIANLNRCFILLNTIYWRINKLFSDHWLLIITHLPIKSIMSLRVSFIKSVKTVSCFTPHWERSVSWWSATPRNDFFKLFFSQFSQINEI